MNKVILIGNIVNDIKIEKTQSGTTIVKNTIAVRRQYKNQEGNYDSDFIRFTAFNQRADFLAQYANKGDRLCLEGSWQTGSYDGANGKVYTNDLIVNNVELLSAPKKERAQAEPSGELEISPEELPFY